MSFDLYLSSRNSLTEDPANCVFSLGLGSALFNARGLTLSLESFSYPNLEPNVNKKNKNLVFRENGGGTDIACVLTEGYYTGAGLAQNLQDALNAAGSNTYSVSYSEDTGYLTVVVVSGTSIVFIGESELTGFASGGTAAGTLVSDFPIRLDGSLYIDITSNLSSSNLTSDGVKNVIKRVPLTVNPQEILFYINPNNNDEVIIDGGSLDTLNIVLRDDKGQQIQLPANAHWAMNLRLNFV